MKFQYEDHLPMYACSRASYSPPTKWPPWVQLAAFSAWAILFPPRSVLIPFLVLVPSGGAQDSTTTQTPAAPEQADSQTTTDYYRSRLPLLKQSLFEDCRPHHHLDAILNFKSPLPDDHLANTDGPHFYYTLTDLYDRGLELTYQFPENLRPMLHPKHGERIFKPVELFCVLYEAALLQEACTAVKHHFQARVYDFMRRECDFQRPEQMWTNCVIEKFMGELGRVGHLRH